MGEIAVLQPQDLLKNRYPRQNLNYSAMKSRRKSSSDGSKLTSNRRRNSPTVTSPPSKPNLVMGQVKILKRGEALTEINNNKEANYQTPPFVQNLKVEELDDFVLSSTDRLGPEPEVLRKKVSLADFYAGSGVIDSPAPSSLPVPSFFVKKVDPTSEIRRMLRLDP